MSMIGELDKECKKLMSWMVKNPQEALKARQTFQEQVIKKRCIHGDEPFHLTLMPLFIKEKSWQLIRETTEAADKLIDKVLNLYFENEEVRDYFPYWDIPEDWIKADPIYKKPTVMNRHDILFDGKTLKFIEFNTDNPGGIAWSDMYEELFAEHPLYSEIISKYGIKRDKEVVSSLKDALNRCYEEMNFAESPKTAIVSFRNIAGNNTESELVRDFLTKNSMEANIVDARDFSIEKGRLMAGGIHYNLILRALRAPFFMRYPRDLRQFIKGVTSGAACMINSFRSVIGSQKSIHSFLSNPVNNPYFTAQELKFIKKYIPWTRRLDETVTLSIEGDEINLRPYILSKREQLVMKPSSGAGGYGVMVGKTTSELKWKEAFEAYQGDPSWIVQEYTEVPEIKIPIIKNNKIVLENRFYNLSPYCIGGKFSGILGRVSQENVINVAAGGGVIPLYPLKTHD